MGGTSTDVSLIDGDIATTTESTVGDFPIRLPVIDIHTVGAGGGSIAYVDSGGALRVGPRSAGGQPGPVCYGAGTELTVTDANLLLGRLDPEFFLGGRMALDVERTRRIAATLAKSLELRVPELAEGIVRVANAEHGARHSRRLGRARTRSAAVRARGVRRRRRHARGGDCRAGSTSGPCSCPGMPASCRRSACSSPT